MRTTQTTSGNYDHYLLPAAFASSVALMLALWFLEEGRHDFGFLWDGEIINFLFSVLIFAAPMIGVYYAIRSWKLPPKQHLFTGLLLGASPALVLIILILLG